MYYVVYGLLWLISLLPLRILYIFSECLLGLVFYVFTYRKQIVLDNLLHAFPEKTAAERQRIAKQFYRNFIDTFMESIKLITMSERQIRKRCTCEVERINELIAKGKNIQVMSGHQFNWEFGNLISALNLAIPYVTVYMPIRNKVLDRIFFKFRKRCGSVLISAPDFKDKMHTVFSGQYLIGLAADQNPGDPANAYWMNFFGRLVPFVTGPSKGAVKYNTAVLMVTYEKIKRGYYHFSVQEIAEEGSQLSPEELTVLYKNALEKIIRKDPANYLWSHRRWKYEWKPEYGRIIE